MVRPSSGQGQRAGPGVGPARAALAWWAVAAAPSPVPPQAPCRHREEPGCSAPMRHCVLSMLLLLTTAGLHQQCLQRSPNGGSPELFQRDEQRTGSGAEAGVRDPQETRLRATWARVALALSLGVPAGSRGHTAGLAVTVLADTGRAQSSHPVPRGVPLPQGSLSEAPVPSGTPCSLQVTPSCLTFRVCSCPATTAGLTPQRKALEEARAE